MHIVLHVEPQTTPVSWDDFVSNYPAKSIALDGFVADSPKRSADNRYFNFNHHEKVDRLATRATCSQVLINIRMGLVRTLLASDGLIHVWVNDCDEDVCLSWWLLKNSHRVEHHGSPILDKLANMEDLLDTTSGMYPFSSRMQALQTLAWVFQPYRQFKLSVAEKDPTSCAGIIADVGNRIEQYLVGNADSLEIDTRFDLVERFPGWALVREIGAQARLGMIEAGIEVYLSARLLPNGNTSYSVGKLQPFTPFDLFRFYELCNSLERTTDDCWGGSDQSGGSPRVSGSTLRLGQVTDIMAACLLGVRV